MSHLQKDLAVVDYDSVYIVDEGHLRIRRAALGCTTALDILQYLLNCVNIPIKAEEMWSFRALIYSCQS